MFCPSGHCLCRTLQNQSMQVWNDLHDAEMLGTPYHEDTITQSLALHLNRQHPAENRVHVFGRTAEGKNGSDFLWLFFDKSLSRYFPVAVQAKRIYPSGDYEAFKAHQVPKIRDYAKVIGGLPIYLMYNYQPLTCRPFLPYWLVERSRLGLQWLDQPRDIGFVFLLAEYLVGVADGKLDTSKVAAHGWPMWQPFCTCSPESTSDPLQDLWDHLTIWTEEAYQPRQGPRETSPLLRQWKTGEEVQEAGLSDVLGLYEASVEGGFEPSFVLGTTLGGPR